MGIPAREIRRAGADPGGQHGGDGAGVAAGDAVRKAFAGAKRCGGAGGGVFHTAETGADRRARSEEHTSELQSQSNLVCRLLLEKKNNHHQVIVLQSRKKLCVQGYYLSCVQLLISYPYFLDYVLSSCMSLPQLII